MNKKTFKIGVLGTMSSGKSTLINTMMETDFLPTSNQACTGCITRILDNKGEKEFFIRARNYHEKIIYKKKLLSLELMEKYTDNDEVFYIDVEGNIPSISDKGLKLQLVDIPGPNISTINKHRDTAYSVIRDCYQYSMILYILNYTSLAVHDDSKLLQDIVTAMNKTGDNLDNRFIFIINKMDMMNYPKENTKKVLESIRIYLMKYGFINPKLFPISASTAYLLRMKKHEKVDKLTMVEQRKLKILSLGEGKSYVNCENYHFEKFASLTPSVKDYLSWNLQFILNSKTEESDIFEELIFHSGVPALEATINEYLQNT